MKNNSKIELTLFYGKNEGKTLSLYVPKEDVINKEIRERICKNIATAMQAKSYKIEEIMLWIRIFWN